MLNLHVKVFGWDAIYKLPYFNSFHQGQFHANSIASAQRGVFFPMGYLGWLVSPQVLIAGGLITLLVLPRRQFFPNSQKIIAASNADEVEE